MSVLNLAWHRFEWPTVEALTGGTFDVAHSPHPLLLPSRSAAQVVTIHDLHFLTHPERTSGEIRRDYPGLARSHARRADEIIVVVGVHARRGAACARGPSRQNRRLPARRARTGRGVSAAATPAGYLLFVGTLDERKNLGGLLEAFGRTLARRPSAPRLVIAGGAPSGAEKWLARIALPPLAGHVEHLGYVQPGAASGPVSRRQRPAAAFL